jgi:electron transport complex protein RnfE
MARNKNSKIIVDGIFSNNAVFMLFLGLCPALATTSSVVDAFGMGLAVLVTIILTNIAISLLRNFIPNEIRIPVLIVIIATIVTVVEMLMKAFLFDLSQTLGVYLSLIIVNCIILGRAEAFAMKNNPLASFFDALGTGVGFLGALIILAFFRELIGTGAIVIKSLTTGQVIFKLPLFEKYAISLFTKAPGAFIMFGLLVALVSFITTKIKERQTKKAKLIKQNEAEAALKGEK